MAQWSDQIFYEFCRGRLDSFYRYIYPDLLVYASGLLQGENAFEANDCVQEAVEKSYFKRWEFSSSSHWKAFLVNCIRNRAISIRRHNDARENYLSAMEPAEEITGDALLDYIEVETRMRLYNAISMLPEDLRQLFNLSFEEGLRNPEIAVRLGVAEITVKKRKARLIERLRSIMGNDNALLLYLFLLP